VSGRGFVRRARPALGTLVELGALAPEGVEDAVAQRWADMAFGGAWRALGDVERALSAFIPASDVGRFNDAPAGAEIAVGVHAAAVLRAADALAQRSGGLLDVTLGTGAFAWSLASRDGAALLVKRSADVRLDLGGIAKGYAVDRAFHALWRAVGRGGACWVNAGGDLRVRGVELPVLLRDEEGGGARPFLRLSEGALATSHFGPSARAHLAGAHLAAAPHVTVVSPRCLWSDALTKIVALSGRADHPLVTGYGAVAWLHA
jgi:thiamine biosynthesis lipoprotein